MADQGLMLPADACAPGLMNPARGRGPSGATHTLASPGRRTGRPGACKAVPNAALSRAVEASKGARRAFHMHALEGLQVAPVSRPGNPQFPFPPFPIWPGNGEGKIFRFPIGRERESGNPPFSDSAGKRESGPRLAANREIGDTLRCEYSGRHDPGLDVALSTSNADSDLPPPSFLNCQGPADGG
jgi:hypothetical protein